MQSPGTTDTDPIVVDNAAQDTESVSGESYDDSEVMGSEYPENDLRMVTDTLITSNGEVVADVLAGIRDSLEKMCKILYKAKK
jgi:hypothetical protein